jgi:hypothetical protein
VAIVLFGNAFSSGSIGVSPGLIRITLKWIQLNAELEDQIIRQLISL